MIPAQRSDDGAMAIAGLYVKCSLRVRNFTSPGLAASDTCQHPADSAVKMPNGNLMWRCHRHTGWQDITGERGAVVWFVRRPSPA
jgi:hypothetical protein